MPADLPNRIVNPDGFGNAFNKLRESGRAGLPLQANGIHTSHTVHGVAHEPAPALPPYGEAGTGENPFAISLSATNTIARVSQGWVITTALPIVPAGCDLNIDLSAPTAGDRFWFWIEITSASAAAIKSSRNTAGDQVWSVNKIPIGWLDKTTSPPTVNQFLRDHVFVPCAF